MKFYIVFLCFVATSCNSSSPNSSSSTSENTTQPLPTVSNPVTAPTFETHFQMNGDAWLTDIRQEGSVNFGVTTEGGEDGAVAAITVSGDQGRGLSHPIGPPVSNQTRRKDKTGFGIYRTRVKAAACSGNEEIVNGIFTYSNDSVSDTNHNGIIDNNEIDIEILCGEPQAIYLTSWTDYTDDGHFLKVTRKVDFVTGEYRQTVSGQEGQYGLSGTPMGTIPEAKLPGLSLTSGYYEMGFEWQPTRLRFFIVANQQEITLWDFQDSRFIPQNPATFMLNLWYPGEHWYGGSATFPKDDATLLTDWFKYWQESA